MNRPHVLVIGHDGELLRIIADGLLREGLEPILAPSGREGLQLVSDCDYDMDVVVTDLRMPDGDGMEILRRAHAVRPGLPVILMTAFASVSSAVGAIRAGAFDYVCKPFQMEELVSAIWRALEDIRVRQKNVLPPGDTERGCRFGNLVGASATMLTVFGLIKRAAVTDTNVLITGESGTGKDLVAKAIHDSSERQRSHFVPINCAGIPESLLESELLGHVRGAFTGATTSRKGLIEEAHGGTLFLDEITELPIVLQAKLLRVLDDKAVRPVGGNRSAVMNFRLITATNKDPRNQVAAGALRNDLFFRLNVINIGLPPLRERKDDLRLLVRHFIEKHGQAQGRNVHGISGEALALLKAYSWPGNVRELENAIEGAVALAHSETIQWADLPAFLHEGQGDVFDVGVARAMTLKELQERYIARILQKTGGNRDQAARILGVHPRTMRRRDRRIEKQQHLGNVPTPPRSTH
jgi:two-component system response regulator HydG